MKSSIATLSLSAALIVSAGALYQSQGTQRDTCAYMERQAEAAAQAPVLPNATQQLGFTPMSQFQKVYPPVCQPANTGADVFSSLVAGALVGVFCYIFGSAVTRFNHRES